MPILLPIVLSGLLMYILYPLQRWSHLRLLGLAGALIWGVLVFGTALFIQGKLVSTTGLTVDHIRLGIAPALEEIFKASLLLFLVLRGRAFSPVAGVIYGFAIGVGFALAETLYFASLTPELALGVGITRAFSTNLMHGAGTAVIGLALTMRDWRVGAIGFLVAIGLHALFNALNHHLAGNLRLIVLVGIGLACVFALQCLINSRRVHHLQPVRAVAD